MTCPIPGLRVSTSAAVPCTVTVSASWPSCSVTFNVGFAFDLQHDAGLDELAESLQLGLEPVGTDRQVLQDVGARFVGDGGARQSGVGLRDRDRDAWQPGCSGLSRCH